MGAIPITKPVYNFPQKTIITELNDSCIKTIQGGTLALMNQMESDFLNNTVSEPTAEDEREVGELFHKEILKEYSLLAVPKRVDSIFNKLIVYSARKDITYKLFLVINLKDSAMVNAFTIPGGNIYITKKLLETVSSDDELAGIIGHEIGHNENRHCTKTVKQFIFSKKYITSDEQLSNIAVNLHKFFTASFGQRDELVSDYAGVYLAYRAGYDPEKLLDFFEKLAKNEKKNAWLQLANSHPYSADRMSCLKQYLKESKVR